MIEKDAVFTLAERYVEDTGVSLFLTGKAGTGKTTFLKEIARNTTKRFAIVAPTGVAAINAEGVTIHSFFRLPLCPYLPDVKELVTEYQMPDRFRSLSKDRIRILRALDLLIIDEISMVRADIMDAMDNVLKRVRRNDSPFGGVQLLMIGDVQQLPPVVTDAEKAYMEQVYQSPFFFSSKALQRLPYVTVELEKIHRQSDAAFLEILNEVRSGTPSDRALSALNARLDRNFTPPEGERWIRLTTHNAQADSVNDAKIEALEGEERIFEARIEGIFPESAYPADVRLRLKEGAQVMFSRNDQSGLGLYYNGKIATVESVSPDLTVRDEDGNRFKVGPEIWQNVRYGLNDDTGEIESIVDGTFVQVPLRLAWAVTIHKSQGLTFDHVIIDAGSAFSFGQVYVALSRCRTLEGIVLSTPITRSCTFTSKDVTSFKMGCTTPDVARNRLPEMVNEYYVSSACEAFSLKHLRYLYNRVDRIYQVDLSNLYPDQAEKFKQIGKDDSGDCPGIYFLSDTSVKFQKQIRSIAAGISQGDPKENPLLKERISKACGYFTSALKGIAGKGAPLLMVEIDDKETRTAFKAAADEFLKELKFRVELYSETERKGFRTAAFHRMKTVSELEAAPSQKNLIKALVPEALKEARRTKGRDETAESTYTGSVNPELTGALVNWRRSRSQEMNIPAYCILHQKTLLAIADTAPSTKEELMAVKGFGKKKYDKYGDEILAIILENGPDGQTGRKRPEPLCS